MTEVGNKVQFRKSRTFVAGLALKQNRPELALKILEGESTYVTMRHIKLLAWAQIGRFDEVIKMLDELIKRHCENKKLKPFSSISVVSVTMHDFICFEFFCEKKRTFLQLNDIERHFKLKASSDERQNYQRIRSEIDKFQLTTNQVSDCLYHLYAA